MQIISNKGAELLEYSKGNIQVIYNGYKEQIPN